jgi:hypothetical protein
MVDIDEPDTMVDDPETMQAMIDAAQTMGDPTMVVEAERKLARGFRRA